MANFDLEQKSLINNIIMIGVDEAGRGSWAGPLIATATWLDFKEYKSLHKEINDSKKLTTIKRKEIILSLSNSVKYCSSISSEREIDIYGLTFANTMAMKRSVFCLLEVLKNRFIRKNFEFQIFIDGKYKPNFLEFDKLLKIKKLKLVSNNIIPVIKGDCKSKTIALASIIAKETRDSIMRQYSLKYPNYSFDKNFGYGTIKHKEAISKYGILRLHRKSFKPVSTICS
tara:strand:+ start:87 stop:770 length:684 start_codon:yes stop_codon:yes gene_type:complete